MFALANYREILMQKECKQRGKLRVTMSYEQAFKKNNHRTK